MRDYKPELDMSPVPWSTEASYHQSQIGVLEWTVKIRRIVMISEVSMLARQLAIQREGHLETVFHIYRYA